MTMTTLSLWNEKPFFRKFFGPELDSWTTEYSFVPPCDIEEREDCFLLSMDIPGLRKEDIQIETDQDTLTISGERKQEKNKTENGVLRMERFSGKFHRAFSLGETIDARSIEASYENGVLKLRLPREKEVKPEVIKIKVGEKLTETH